MTDTGSPITGVYDERRVAGINVAPPSVIVSGDVPSTMALRRRNPERPPASINAVPSASATDRLQAPSIRGDLTGNAEGDRDRVDDVLHLPAIRVGEGDAVIRFERGIRRGGE